MLARLHTSQMDFPGLEPDPVAVEFHALAARAEPTLQALPSGPELVHRFRVSMHRVRERAGFNRQQTPAPIHGALSWDCIYYGADGEFYLYRFESCRRSDPRLDLGGFAADLLCFALAMYDDASYRLCSSALVSKYNSEAAYPVGEDDLQPYIVLALCQRLQRAELRTKAGTAQLLAALDAVLGDTDTAAARGASS